jgi:hypothetical protein
VLGLELAEAEGTAGWKNWRNTFPGTTFGAFGELPDEPGLARARALGLTIYFWKPQLLPLFISRVQHCLARLRFTPPSPQTP